MKKYRLGDMPAAADPALLAKLERVEVASIGHIRHTGFVHRSIQAINPAQKPVAGIAVTVALTALCSTLMHYAVSRLRPGDFLVVDRLGDDRHACVGGVVARAAMKAGAAGIILDGPCTDVAEILAEGLPLWCRGTSAICTRQADIGGTWNRPIACGNVPVLPGDYILADASGIVVMPDDEADELAEICIAREIRVARTMTRVGEGEILADITGANRRVAEAMEQDLKL